MAENKETDVIRLRDILRELRSKKKKFIKPLAIVFVLAAVYIYSQPRYYTTDVKLAPETDQSMPAGSLSSLASSFGIDMGNFQTSDAITPAVYPNLIEDNGFISKLFDVHVKTRDGKVSTTYYDYMKKHQKQPWWGGITDWIFGLLGSSDDGGEAGGDEKFDPYMLSKDDDVLVKTIQTKLNISFDLRNALITIMVTDQDPLVCKTMADSITVILQEMITNYRTNKARIDYAYYKALTDSAYMEYEQALKAYSRYADANTNVILQSHRSKMNDLENDVQLKYTTYTTLSAQLQQAKGKVQERTPAFTTIKGAALPIRPAGPKRMFFIFGMLFLTTVITSFVLLKNYLFGIEEKQEERKKKKEEEEGKEQEEN